MQVLTEFITQEADKPLKGQEHMRIGDGKVSLGEWVDLCTEDSVNFKTMIEMVNHIPAKKKHRLLDEFNAHPGIVKLFGVTETVTVTDTAEGPIEAPSYLEVVENAPSYLEVVEDEKSAKNAI